MAQEFASDNSKTGLFSRLKLSNHRGFFSFIFVTLSVIFILITFAAVQQQQTTQSKATTNICSSFSCETYVRGLLTSEELKNTCNKNPCCEVAKTKDNISYYCSDKLSASLTCSGINNIYMSTSASNNALCGTFSSKCESVSGKCQEKPIQSAQCIKEGGGVNVLESGVDTCCSGLEFKLNSESSYIGKCVKPSEPTQSFGQACRVSSSNCFGILMCIPNGPGLLDGKCGYPEVGIGQRCKDDRGNTVATCKSGLTCSPIDGGTCVRSTTGTTPTPTPGPGPGTSGGADSACTSVSGRCLTGQTGREGKDCKNIPGQAGSGKIQSGLCSGGQDRKCCVPNSSSGGIDPDPTDVKCSTFTAQNTCTAVNTCKWINNTKCRSACNQVKKEVNCNDRNDCAWKNNQCVNKSGSGPSENVGDADLNLKLSFQGIVTLPKTKTELKVKVRLVDVENREKENDASTFTADANGIWSGKVSFENVDLSQKYYLLIKGPMHVQKKICKADAADPNPGYYSCQFGNITLNSGSNDFDFSQVKMLVGDLDQNGIVDREDTGPLLNALLLDLDQRKSTGILEKLDLNLDGIVEPKDWSLMLEALKIKYDEK